MKYYKWAFLLLLPAANSSAQYLNDGRFAPYLQTMPAPKQAMEETQQLFGDNLDNILQVATKTPTSQRDFILRAFLNRIKQHKELSRYGAEEQKIIRNVEAAAKDYSEDSQLSGLNLLMEDRPLVASGKLSWQKLTAPLSPAGQAHYQQLLKIEKKLSWPSFYNQAVERSMLRDMFAKDTALEAVNREVNAAADIQDPKKIAAIIKSAHNKLQIHYQAKHRVFYTWWTENENRVRQCALEMDAFLDAIDNGGKLHGSDTQLIPIVADVEERIWSALIKLNDVTRTIATNAQSAAGDKKATEEALDIYKKMDSSN